MSRLCTLSVIAVRFGVAIAVAFIGAASVCAQEVFDEGEGQYATRQLLLSLELKSQRRLKVVSVPSLEGTLNISVADQSNISVSYVKRAKTDKLSRAIDYIDLIGVDLSNTPQGAVLQFRAPNPPPWNGKLESALVEAELILPESLIVEIDAAYFNVHADGPFKGMLVPSSLGRLEISDVHGRLDIATANRRVWVSDISGEVSVSTTNSTLTAEKIRCPASQAKFANEGGEIRITDLEGGINVRNSYGRVDIDKFVPSGKSNFVRGQSGPIVIAIERLTDARIVVSNRYEDIELTLPKYLSAAMSLAVDDEGKIEATGFPFNTDLVERNRLNLVAGTGDATVSASIRGKGNIWVRGVDKGE